MQTMLPRRTEAIYGSQLADQKKKSVRISDDTTVRKLNYRTIQRSLLRSKTTYAKRKHEGNLFNSPEIQNNKKCLLPNTVDNKNSKSLDFKSFVDEKIKNRTKNETIGTDNRKDVLLKSKTKEANNEQQSKPVEHKDNKEKVDFKKIGAEYIQSAMKKKEDFELSKRSLIPSKADVRCIDEKLSPLKSETDSETINPVTLPTKLLHRSSLPKREIKKDNVTVSNKLELTVSKNSMKQDSEGNKSTIKMSENTKQKDKPEAQRKPTNLPDNQRKTLKEMKEEKIVEDVTNTETNSFLMVAAIDFGTSYSGYAFSSFKEHKRNPMLITAKLWSSSQFKAVKTSTSILFDDKRRFHSFGFEAEEKYLRLLEDEDSNVDEWFYFSRFKMILYQNMNINTNTKLKDNQGKRMSALKVFSAAIGYMKADLLAMCYAKDSSIGQEQIRWVLTVPALWNDNAKTFMREAANRAGIPNNSLVMALEPEAASLYCIEWMKRSDATELERGEKFIVLDAGGGTVDIAVHQIQENGRIKELNKASGGDWGGIKVDQEFDKLLKDIVGRDLLSEIKKQYMSDYMDIFHSFERAKRRDFSIVGHGKVQLTFPNIINRLCLKTREKDVNELISENLKFKNNIRLIKDKLEIDLALFKSLFAGAIYDIVNHLSILFRQSQVTDLTTMFMVGGYSECYLLQEAIRFKFSSLRVLIPPNSVLSVLKGAVLYGHSPRTFQSRISTFTYGIETTEPFRKGYPVDKKIFINGKSHCDKIFCIHVKDGEHVNLGKSVSKAYKTIDPDQTHMEFIVYASIKRTPKFTDEDGCFQLGSLTVDVSKMSCNKYGEKQIRLELIYGGTELEAIATDTTTGKTSREHFTLARAGHRC
ncbi:heat shock 70 kDa protein 12A-like [Mytilus edulis]